MNTRTRLFVGFGLLVLLLAALGAFTIYRLTSIASLAEKLHQHPFAVAKSAQDFRADVRAIHRSMKDVVLARDDVQMRVALGHVSVAENAGAAHLKILQAQYLGEKRTIESLRSDFLAWRSIRQEVVVHMTKGDRESAADITTGKGAAHVALLEGRVDEVVQFANAKADEFRSRAQSDRRHAVIVLIVLLASAVTISAVVAFLVTRSVVKPLAQAVELAEAVKSGDLTRRLKMGRRDEIGRLGASLDAMTDSLAAHEVQQQRAQEALQQQTDVLGERVKELDCLYDTSQLMADQGKRLEEVLRGIADLVPRSWQYPEITCARVVLDGERFETENFAETAWKLSADIAAAGKKVGVVEVCYLEERPPEQEGPFLSEERHLIDALARSIGAFVERRRAEEVLQEKTREIAERAKELDCLYQASQLMADQGKSLEETLQGMADLIPASWQYPEIACARIALGGERFETEKFAETAWKLSADIAAAGKKVGAVEVCYLEERPPEQEGPFLSEERHLIDALARSIGVFVEHKLAEEEFKRNQYHLTKAQEIGVIGTWELDIQKNILIWTDENYKIFGVPQGTEMTYELFLDCVHPDDRDYVHERWSAGLNKEPYDIEHRVIANDRVKWVRERADVEFDAEGKPISAIGVTQDITERKRVEEHIARQAATLAAIGDVLRAGLTCESEEELGKTCLAVAEKLTGSEFGFLGEINRKGLLDDTAISNPGWDACKMAVADARKYVKDMPIRGIDRSTIREGKSRIVNKSEMATHPDRVGTPEGHPEVTAFLGVPLKHQGETIGMIGLGNKETGYQLADQEAVEQLAEAVVEALRSKRAEDALKESRERLTKESAAVTAIIGDMLRGELGDAESEKRVLNACLAATGSDYGMIGVINEHGKFDTTTYNSRTMQDCAFPEALAWDLSTGMDIRGIWGSAMLHGEPLLCNDLPAHPDRVGYPEGHVPIHCFLGVPLKREGNVVGMLAVANKPGGYAEADVGTLTRLASVMTVSRQHRETMAQLRTTGEKLEASNKELEAFAYSVSHDLRAPLRGMDGFSQALLEDYGGKLEEQGRDYLNRVRAGAQRMGELIEDLLKLSRVTRREMVRKQVDLSALGREIAADLKESEPARDVVFSIREGLVADGDRVLLRAALENLLGNAWKFTGKQAKAVIEFGATEHEGQTAYFVKDDGAGFDMAYADKLFGAFQRLHSSKDFTGTGIGLATVQRIINRHGGRVWAEGEVGKGATFYFTL